MNIDSSLLACAMHTVARGEARRCRTGVDAGIGVLPECYRKKLAIHGMMDGTGLDISQRKPF